MNNKTVVTNDDLPDCWIKRPSKSRPDRFYYYNTVTQQSQWTLPVSPGDKRQKPLTDKRSAESPKGNDGKCFKISNSSKQIKKSQAKTPAQDRLQNLAKQLKNSSQAKVRAGNVVEQLKNTSPAKSRAANVVRELKNSTPVQCRLQNYARKGRTESEPLNVIKRTKVDVDKSKLKDVQNVTTPTNNINRSVETRTPHKPCMNHSNPTVSTDEIPSLFPPKTPGQNRLDRLRHSLNSENANTPSESAQHALTVIQSEFGLASTTLANVGNHIAHTVIDEDEPMDWEPCDVFEQVENVVYNESKRAYIVPDTNVFLDELSCIRDTIHSDGKYNVLVPFVVLQELDRLKGRTGDSRISNLASGAIRFIFNELKSKTQRLQGQKATEDCSHLINVVNADDKILNCCLQLMRQSRDTILISNDINLCNKALASGVPTMTSKEYKATHN